MLDYFCDDLESTVQGVIVNTLPDLAGSLLLWDSDDALRLSARTYLTQMLHKLDKDDHKMDRQPHIHSDFGSPKAEKDRRAAENSSEHPCDHRPCF